MNISELIRNTTIAAAMAAVATFAAPSTVVATSDEGGAGETSGAVSSETGATDISEENSAVTNPSMDEGGAGATSGASSSESGYSVEPSTPAATSEDLDEGGAGATSGEASDETGAIGQPSPLPSPVDDTTGADSGGAGTTSGSASSAGAALSNQIKGTIDSVDAARRSVTIRDSQGNLASYKLEAGGKVRVGDRNASLSSLSNGSNVTITLASDDPTKATEIKVGS